MFRESDVLEAVKAVVAEAGIEKGKPITTDSITNAIAASIYKVITSSDYVRFVVEEMYRLK